MKDKLVPWLYRFIRDKIRSGGPITVHDYMQLCVNSGAGYYSRQAEKKKIIGAEGDFVTSPEISQLFGELVGVWVVNELKNTGFRDQWQLVELGAGTGVLMCDVLSVLRQLKISNFQVHIVEKSDELIATQQRALCGVKNGVRAKSKQKNDNDAKNQMQMKSFTGVPIQWHRSIDDLPEQFSVFIANEFLDALPIHQFQRLPNSDNEWREVYVALSEDDQLEFVLSRNENLHTKGLLPDSIRFDPNRCQWEVSPTTVDTVGRIVHRFTERGGFALFIDYGHDGGRLTPSLRAYNNHKQVHVLSAPGEIDITADVDFGHLRDVFENKCLVFGPVSQRNFLFELGITHRLMQLMKKCKTIEKREYLHDSFKMLMQDSVVDDEQSNGMGTAFKAFSLFPKTLTGIMRKRGGSPIGF